jgi:hypothetical protein
MGLEAYVRERNADLSTDLLMKGGLGLLFTGLVYVPLFFAAWSFALVAFGTWRYGLPFGAAATGLLLVVSFRDALRGEDPLRGLERLSDEESARREMERYVALAVGLPYARPFGREAIAGLGSVLIAGPRSLVEAARAHRAKFDEDPATLDAGAALLEKVIASDKKGGVSFERVEQWRAAALILRLGLVEPWSGEGEKLRLRSTAKGRQIADA